MTKKLFENYNSAVQCTEDILFTNGDHMVLIEEQYKQYTLQYIYTV